ncbi:MAG: hypothetical protein RIR70_445 [Pseudomonadota bacterium]|jgi:predicted Fe-S protein YdhL (DUF1289 family)
MSVVSPCIKVCKLDPVSGVCVGCYRTADEIARWLDASEREKRDILQAVEKRKAEARGKC